MIARITLILTMLLSTASAPSCDCTTGDNGLRARAAAATCPHCRTERADSEPRPDHVSCCCHLDNAGLLTNDTDVCRALDAKRAVTVDATVDGQLAAASRTPLNAAAPSVQPAGPGGRALLLRTHRMLI